MINNNPHYNNRIIKGVRGTIEHRATWLYLLLDEAEKQGISWEDFAKKATYRCGCFQGRELVVEGRTKSLKGLKKTLFTLPAQKVFEMDILQSTDDILSINFHYCPLVAAWQKQGCTDEQIAKLCDIAMEGDRGIAKMYGCEMTLGKVIAKGDNICEVRFKRQRYRK